MANIQQGPNLVLDMSNTSPWGDNDPWVGVKKCLSILYSYGTTIRTFVACEGDGPFTLFPGNNKQSHTNDITRQGPSSPNFAIVSVVWGAEEITSGSVYQSIYNYRTNKSAVPFSNELFGKDTLPSTVKSGVIWYTEDNFASFRGSFGREGDKVSLG